MVGLRLLDPAVLFDSESQATKDLAMNLDATKTHIAHQWKHGRPMIACCFDPQGRYLFSSSEDYTLQRWELESGTKTAWPAHESWIRDIVFLPDGETVISGGCDDRLFFWQTTADVKETDHVTGST